MASNLDHSEMKNELLVRLAPALRGMLGDGRNLPICSFDDSSLMMTLVASDWGKEILTGKIPAESPEGVDRLLPVLVPYSEGDDPEDLIQAAREKVEAYNKEFGALPVAVAVQRLGLFVMGRALSEVQTISCSIAEGLEKAFERNPGNPGEVGAKQFTDTLMKLGKVLDEQRKQPVQGRVANKIALVTGAAQGFGLGIAKDLAREGACVVLADINVEGARKAAADIEKEAGMGRAIPAKANVCDADSIGEVAAVVARAYGGLDVLISNAGVLKAESVKTQSEKDFDFVTQVNYRGYFICVKHLCPLLATQHEFNKNYRADIIQINSKSGLEGSKRNFAYAGGKFGGVGLTQSFALELIEDGIKVNSICPGNFFDGPLWSDPENGLFVQYLRAGKIPGAETIEDVKRGYEAKVPMGRGCEVRDVMHAVYYVIDQQYETGQAVPVTGGQVMLK